MRACGTSSDWWAMSEKIALPAIVGRALTGAGLGALGGVGYHAFKERTPTFDLDGPLGTMGDLQRGESYVLGAGHAKPVQGVDQSSLEALQKMDKIMGPRPGMGQDLISRRRGSLVELRAAAHQKDADGRLIPVVVHGDAKKHDLVAAAQALAAAQGTHIPEENLAGARHMIEEAAKPWWGRGEIKMGTDLVALYALRDELRKEAAGTLMMGALGTPRVHAALGGAGALGGIGAAGGALIGAGVEGVKGYRAARQEGAGVGSALGSGAGAALGGAQHGAMVGGAAGLAAGGLGGLAAPGRMESARQALTGAGAGVGAVARFGQRQVHAITGWRPGADTSSIRSIGAGAHNAQEALSGAVDKANQLHAAGTAGKELDHAVRGVDAAKASYGAAYRAERMGITSAPGYVKSMKDNGVLPTMAAGAREQWHGMSPGWKALMVGAPVAETINAVRTPDQEGGPGKGERVARGLAGAVAGATMGTIPMTTGNVLQQGISRAAGLGGRAYDRFRRPSFEQSADASAGQVVPAERHMSENAQGHRPEVSGGLV